MSEPCQECARLKAEIVDIRSRPEGMTAKQLRENNRKLREAADVAKAIAQAEAGKMAGGVYGLLDKYHDRAFRAEETARELREAMVSWKDEAERLRDALRKIENKCSKGGSIFQQEVASICRLARESKGQE